MSETCFFKTRYEGACESQRANLSHNSGPDRIESIINASKIYEDGLCSELECQFRNDRENTKIAYHKNCVSKYTSKTNLSHQQNRKTEHNVPSTKRLRYSLELFDFNKNCLYCGDQCEVERDERNPSR